MLRDWLLSSNQRFRASRGRWGSAGLPALSPVGYADLRLKPLTGFRRRRSLRDQRRESLYRSPPSSTSQIADRRSQMRTLYLS